MFEPFEFRLIGRKNVFLAKKVFFAAGFIPSVYGETKDGKLSTTARIADVITNPNLAP